MECSGKYTGRLETGIDRLHCRKAADEQTGARQQYDGKRDLRHHEGTAHSAQIDARGLAAVPDLL